MFTSKELELISDNLLNAIYKQLRIDITLSDIEENCQSINQKETLFKIKKLLKEDFLSVLVMGKFGCGKTTFLNALMGQKLLPAKATPTTADISEIVYSETAGVTLYPKNGYEGSNKPFNIKINELADYIDIDHTETKLDKRKSENSFSKIVIKYPLSICKHGIMFVDFPGLDPTWYEEIITKEYPQTADAIIYCMNSCNALSAADKSEIERLISLGYKSIIFVLTYYNVLLYNDDMNGTNDAENAKRHYINLLSRYTDLGENGIFFVDSLAALNAKLNNKPELLVRSNFPLLEKRFEGMLYLCQKLRKNVGKLI